MKIFDHGKSMILIKSFAYLIFCILLSLISANLQVKAGGKTPYFKVFKGKWSEIENTYSKELIALAKTIKPNKEIAALMIMRVKECAHEEGALSEFKEGFPEPSEDSLSAEARWFEATLWPDMINEKKAGLVCAGKDMKEFDKIKKPSEDALKSLAKKLEKLNKTTASDFYKLAGEAFKRREIGRAYQAIRNVLKYDANHGKTRKALGCRQYKKAWLQQYDIIQLKRKLIWTDKWGWVGKKTKSQLEKGKYPLKGKLLSREAYLNALKSSWSNAITVETEHFTIESNAGLEDVVKAGQLAERHYKNYFALFSELLIDKSKGISTGFIPPSKKKFPIKYYVDQESFRKLAQKYFSQQIANEGGFFSYTEQLSCIWKDESHNNWYWNIIHECTHQIIDFHKKYNENNLKTSNAWACEALPSFMEDIIVRDDGSYSVLKDPRRMSSAKNMRRDKTLIPFPVLVKMNNKELLARCGREVAQYGYNITYGQLSAIIHFFMSYNEGEYRQRFMGFLKKAYYETVTPDSLEKHIGVKLEILDEQFSDWLGKLDI
ncbi:MAG: hypothetical protein E3J72_09510 [Planctomycetota bacterium]|nr:MAG: hypothetical protein E3J72_09510 [Planctomycetota bacterium]